MIDDCKQYSLGIMRILQMVSDPIQGPLPGAMSLNFTYPVLALIGPALEEVAAIAGHMATMYHVPVIVPLGTDPRWIWTHWHMEDVAAVLRLKFSNSSYRIVAWKIPVKLFWCECHLISLMRSKHWFRWWLGAVWQQAIDWAYVDPDLYRHIATLGHVALTHYDLNLWNET